MKIIKGCLGEYHTGVVQRHVCLVGALRWRKTVFVGLSGKTPGKSTNLGFLFLSSPQIGIEFT
jgi:hypothetical protein